MSAFRFLLPLLLLGCGSASVPAEPLAPGRYERTLDFGGIKRNYIIRVPKQAADGKPLPVVIALHGWTGSAKAAEVYFGIAKEAEARGYISVHPDGLGKQQGWNVGWIDLSGGNKQDDAGFVNALLDETEKLAVVDKDREYVCGHSNGAFLTQLVASQYGKRLAAVGAVAGTIGMPTKTIPDPKDPVSVLMIHGKMDPVVAYEPTAKATLKGVSAPDSAKWWAKFLGADEKPTMVTSGGGNIITESWKGKGGKDVQLVSIVDGNHNWPGGPTSALDAAKVIMDFFDAHRR